MTSLLIQFGLSSPIRPIFSETILPDNLTRRHFHFVSSTLSRRLVALTYTIHLHKAQRPWKTPVTPAPSCQNTKPLTPSTEAEIPQVIHLLTQSPPSTQRKTIEKYFTPSASFTHPLCRTGSFEGSRWLIWCIYRWYKIMSPRIEISVDSVGMSFYFLSSSLFYLPSPDRSFKRERRMTMMESQVGAGKGIG